MCARRLRKVIQYAYYVPIVDRTYMVDELQDNPGFYGIVYYDEDGEQHPVRRNINPLPDRPKIKSAEKDLKEIMSGMFRSTTYIQVTQRHIAEEIDEPDPTVINDVSEEKIEAKRRAEEEKLERKQERKIRKIEKDLARKKRLQEREEKAKIKKIRAQEKQQAREEKAKIKAAEQEAKELRKQERLAKKQAKEERQTKKALEEVVL